MSLRDRHVIDAALFELEVPDTGVVVVDYVRTRLLPLAEAIFDEFSQPGRVVRIDRLELDLGGSTPGSDWPRELERRFEEALRAELRSQVEGSAVPSATAELDALAHLLRTGTLPWAGWSGADGSPDAFAGRVIRGDPGGFARFLRSARGGGVVVDRLVRQSSEATLAAALAALAGGREEEWEERLRRAGAMALDRAAIPEGVATPHGTALPGGSRTPDGTPTAGPGGAIPEGTKTAAGGEALRRAWAGDLLHRMRRSRPSNAAGLPGGAPSPGGHPRGEGAGDPVPEYTSVAPASLVEIRERLGAALHTGRLEEVAAELPEWVRNRPGVVADTLRASGTSRRIRRGLVHLPDSTLMELVRALDPSVVGVVTQLLRNPQELPGRAPGGAEGLPHPQGLGPRVREAILAHLILGDHREGGPAGLVEGVRLHMAELDEGGAIRSGARDVSALDAGMLDAGASDAAQAAVARSRAARVTGEPDGALWTGKGEGADGAMEGSRGEPSSPAPGLPSPYALLQQLLQEDPRGTAVPSALEALLAGHPDDLLRLLELVRTCDLVLMGRMALWPEPGVRALADALLSLVSRESSDGGAALRESVTAAGGGVADPRGFFLELIRVMGSGGWVDLERLRAVHVAPTGAHVLGPGESPATPPSPGARTTEGTRRVGEPLTPDPGVDTPAAASPGNTTTPRASGTPGDSPTGGTMSPEAGAPPGPSAWTPGASTTPGAGPRTPGPITTTPGASTSSAAATAAGAAPTSGAASTSGAAANPGAASSPGAASTAGVAHTPAPCPEGSGDLATPPPEAWDSPGGTSSADSRWPERAGRPADGVALQRPSPGGPLPASTPHPGGGTSVPARAGGAASGAAGTVQHLLQQGMGGGPEDTPDPVRSGELRRAVEAALSEDAVQLRRVMERSMEEADTIEALLSVLPGPTLARVLLLLRPGAADLLRALDVVAGAAFQQRRNVAGVEREKWRFLFRRLVAEGRLPLLEDTVRAFFEQLLAGPGDAAAADAAPGDGAAPDAAHRDAIPGDAAHGDAAAADPSAGRSAPWRAAPGESTASESVRGQGDAGRSDTGESVAAGAVAGHRAPEASPRGSTPMDLDRLLNDVRARVAARTLTTPSVGQRILEALSRPRASREGPSTSGASAAPRASGAGLGATSGTPPAPPSGPIPPASREAGMASNRGAGPAWTTTETLFIANAGIVLAAPYLPRLFSMLDLATDRSFHSPEHAARGSHLIQCLVEGRSDRPEHLLPLNKILCGLGEEDVLPAAIQPTPREEEMVSGLLSAILQNWGALGSTTTEGLQESFFQREGALRLQGEAWRLQVEPRAFDMLIDRMPWSFNIIRFGWMDRVLHVDWRG